jgi:hypothetical protein
MILAISLHKSKCLTSLKRWWIKSAMIAKEMSFWAGLRTRIFRKIRILRGVGFICCGDYRENRNIRKAFLPFLFSGKGSPE